MNVEESLKTYKIILRPILEYCSAIYLETTQKVIDTIEKVQIKAIRITVVIVIESLLSAQLQW